MKNIIFAAIFLSLSACAHCGGGKDKMHNEHFAKMDKNSDGKLSKEEFTKGHDEKFAMMDLNKDGFVTQEEKSQAHKEMMKAKCDKCKN